MTSFDEILLNPEIRRAISDLGFSEPTPIQSEAIPHLLNSNRDLIALAQTGTGKTAAYGIPVIQQIDLNSHATQVLVICPTRELCMQITNDLLSFSKYMKGVKITAVYGGASIDTQINMLRKGSQIVVGTPGRMLDLIKRKKLNVTHIACLILDEADEMLTMGFKEELNSILEGTPAEKQTLLFSATMPAQIKAITNKYMRNPYEITIGKKNAGAENVRHQYYMVHADDKYETLKRIADFNPNIYGIVFCRTREETKTIADKLLEDGYNADALHGDLSQAQRDIVMNRFRDEYLQLLIATDVAARGLDVNNLSHIINFNLPEDPDLYLHRSGRTGRAGKSGISISIINAKQGKFIKELEKKLAQPFERLMVPNGVQVCQKRLLNLIDKIHQVEVDEEQIYPFLPEIYDKFASLSWEDLVKKFVWVEFDRFLSYYKDSADLNIVARKEGESKGTKKANPSKEKFRDEDVAFARFFINIGSNQKITAQRLMGIVNEKMRNRSIPFGKIEIMKKFSFFEIDARYTKDLVRNFEYAEFEDLRLFVEPVKKEKHQSAKESWSEKSYRPGKSYQKDRKPKKDKSDNKKKRDKKSSRK